MPKKVNPMRKLFFLVLLCLVPVFSCDDGDVITFELDFEESFLICEGVSNAVLYKTKDDPAESLSVLVSSLDLEDLLNIQDDDTATLTKTNSTLYYRTYSNESLPSNLFCNDVQPAEIKITNNDESSCTADFSTILVEDDNDGIASELEDIDGDGNLKNDDTDGDGLPNYIDLDDDGDNVPTADENADPNEDGDLSDAQDTDGDNIPDYLDSDDDGDGVLTRDEENDTQNNNPQDDITNTTAGPDYLNDQVTTEVPATAYRSHSYSQTYLISLKLTGISLELIAMDELDFGVLENSALTETVTDTPDFN